MNKKEILKFYKEQLENDFFPYWAVFWDRSNDGILNCLNNYGDKIVSTNKFTWSEGRWLWILGKLYENSKNNILTDIDMDLIEGWMKSTWNFIINHSIMENGCCCFLLKRDGSYIKDEKSGRYDTSIYADCFALIGMSEYIKVKSLYDEVYRAENLYNSIVSRIESGNYLTDPYPIPKDYVIHGIPMILVNTVYEYCKMRRELNLPYRDEFDYVLKNAHFIIDKLYDGKGHIREHVSLNNNIDNEDNMLNRHINPGHTMEDLWFLAEVFEESGELDKYLPRMIEIAKTTFELGWDPVYGGLLRFVDKDGGRPKGRFISDIPEPYEKLVMDTWDMKLWWPHSEILYLFLLLYEKSKDEELYNLYQKSAEYVFRTFPNKDKGEWIQIRSRDGKPEEKLVALPVKDPFHIMRNFIKIVELYG